VNIYVLRDLIYNSNGWG